MKRLLVVVDMQRDFITGALGSAKAQSVVGKVKELIERERAAGTEIVFTQDTHGADYLSTQEGRRLPVVHAVKGTAGWEIIPELRSVASGARVFEKSAFSSPELAVFAQEGSYDEITLCGVCTDICVISNALLLKAYCPETTVRVVSSACAGTSAENHSAALTAMKCCQVEII